MLSTRYSHYVLGNISQLGSKKNFNISRLVTDYPIGNRISENMIGVYTPIFICNTFIINTRLELAKYQSKSKQNPEAKLLLFEDYSFSSWVLSSKTSIKKPAKNKCVCFNEIIWLIIMEMMLKMKNRLHRYDINRTRSRYGHKYSIYDMFLSVMMFMYNKQHLSNIWSWIHEKVKKHWGRTEKSVAYKKTCSFQ